MQKNAVKSIRCFFLLLLPLLNYQMLSQTLDEERISNLEKRISVLEDSISVNRKKEKQSNTIKTVLNKVSIGGMFQTRFISSLSSGIAHNSIHFGDQDHSSNTFDIRRARLSVQAEITPKIKINVLTNFADFKSDTKTRVLENAYLGFKYNKYLNFRIGQFRPLVGPENIIPVDIVKSLDFSNQYYSLGANGWGSFQVGMDVSGSVDIGKIPMSYSVAIVNGNGKNKLDTDNGKLFIARDAFNLYKKYKLEIGINGSWGRVMKKDVYMGAIDITSTIPIASQWSLFLQGQGGKAINHNEYLKASNVSTYKINDYIMQGWFILPNLRYEAKRKYLHSVEFSCRIEEWEVNKLNDNKKTSVTPALSFEFIENYKLRLVIAMQMDRYKKNIPLTSFYNSNLLTIQLQARF
ncbi:porin [Apibacter sp. HY039]|uniref:porin n=1 Tax=Apibacter sp. HY039 TaxID=2501476 RepID=UPI000FEB83EE|nr:porin [Apibacter sp. HY039]